MGDTAVEVALSIRAEHAEGPVWDAETGCLWWIDICGRRLHRFDPRSGQHSSWGIPEEPGGVIVSAKGEPVIATPDGLAVFDCSSGTAALVTPVEQDRPENRANDAKVDPRGRAWVGTMAYDKRPRNAALYLVAGATTTRAIDGLTISNGPAFDNSATRLYLADTALGVIDVYSMDPATGALSDRQRFVDLSETLAWPDGMTVDDEGMLWVALGRAAEVHRYRLDGTLDGVIEVPANNPTSVAFGGVDRGDLYITTSWIDCEPDRRAIEPVDGAILRCRPGVTGPPSPRWQGIPATGEPERQLALGKGGDGR